MTKFLSFIIILITLIAPLPLSAQELNCNVEVNHDQVQGTNTSIFETLREAIAEYMNNTRFSNAQIANNERIECRLFFTIKDYTDDVLKGDLQVQAIRPVYNSSYTTTLLNIKDTRIEFTYREHEPLVFSETTMESNLTAILNFYAYLILATDFDSFSPRGGDIFFDRLQSIVQLAQSSGEIGWRTFEDNRNRAAVLNAFTDPQTAALRQITYDYHRRGLDEMSVSPDKGRANISATLLENLKKVHEAAPMTVGLTMFHDAKLDELINVYSKGSQSERESIYDLLKSLYPTEDRRLIDIKNPPVKK